MEKVKSFLYTFFILLFIYKILFGLTDLQASEFFEKAPLVHYPSREVSTISCIKSILLPQSEPNSVVNEITYWTLLILVGLLALSAPSKL